MTKPSDFFIGVVDFFAILLPGASERGGLFNPPQKFGFRHNSQYTENIATGEYPVVLRYAMQNLVKYKYML